MDSTVSIAEADVDFVLKRLHKSKAILEQVQSLAENREREHQRKVAVKQTAYNAAVESVKYIRLELTQTSSEQEHERLMNDLLDVNDRLEHATIEELTEAVEALKPKPFDCGNGIIKRLLTKNSVATSSRQWSRR